MLATTIKTALENVVLCRGANGPKESYEYAERMEIVIKEAIKQRLLEALEETANLEERVCTIIDELN